MRVQNTTFDGNVVNGEPAGDQEVAISMVKSEVYASPRMRVWVWPDGPFILSAPDVKVAEAVIMDFARPLLRAVQEARPSITCRLSGASPTVIEMSNSRRLSTWIAENGSTPDTC